MFWCRSKLSKSSLRVTEGMARGLDERAVIHRQIRWQWPGILAVIISTIEKK